MNGIQELFMMEIAGDMAFANTYGILFFSSNHSSVYSVPVLTEPSLYNLNSHLGPKANSIWVIKGVQGLSLSTGLFLVPAV